MLVGGETAPTGESTRITLGVLPRGVGSGGNIDIKAGSLILTEGAIVKASAQGEAQTGADAGSVTIEAGIVDISGSVPKSGLPSGVFSSTDTSGKAGDITVNAQKFRIADGAALSARTNGDGQGGNITVKTGSFEAINGGQLIATTFGKGQAGNIFVDSKNEVFVSGRDSNYDTRMRKIGNYSNKPDFELVANYIQNGSQSGLFVNTRGEGDGGNLTINTSQLLVRDRAEVSASAFGEGDSGKLIVDASEKVELISGSGLFAQVNPNAKGNAGELLIDTHQLLVGDGALVSVNTLGQGNGGKLTIDAKQKVELMGNGSRLSAQVNPKAIGNGGDINITTGLLSMTNGAELTVVTTGKGNSGNINITADQFSMTENAALIADLGVDGQGRGGNINLDVKGEILLVGGETAPTGESTRITLGVLPNGRGSGGNIDIKAGSFILQDGAIIKNSTQGQGNAGNIYIKADVVDISGSVPSSGLPSGLFTSTNTNFAAGNITVDTRTFRITNGAALSARSKGDGQGGNIRVNTTGSFEAANGGQLVSTTFGRGQAGDIFINAESQIVISGNDPNYTERLAKFPNPISSLVANDIKETGSNSGLFTNTEPNSIGQGGSIGIQGNSLTLKNSQINARTQGTGIAGSINVNVNGLLSATDSDIITAAEQSNGGAIALTAKDIRLFGDSDITTNVGSGAGDGGNINLTANSIVAFNDSDILAFARDGKGGDITFNTPAFFGQNYLPAPSGTDPRTLDGNNLVDVNASGRVSGAIALPDTSFLQNSLSELPENLIDTSNLIANSCIARNQSQEEGSFTITGSGGLADRPGDALMSVYAFRAVRTIPNASPSTNSTRRPWQKGDPIVEPQGVYRLPSGQLVLSRECAER
ncbi:hypothetical protein NUACC21_29550 [Scytonema sp. NUACC21]